MSSLYSIDAHHHFWDPSNGDYSWMTAAHAPINRVFTPDDLKPSLRAAGVAKTVLVQTWSSFEETEQFLAVAAASDFIAGVVGWVDLTATDVGGQLDALLKRPDGKWLVGIRHQVHDEPDANWLLRDDVKCGLAAVQDRDLAYDLLIRPRELDAALETVAQFPELRFVIDHIAKPNIKSNGFEAWALKLRAFHDHRSHVWCKLSGMVTEADWSCWRADDITPYIREVIDIFGAQRCMFGSDWPVCLLAAGYEETVELLRTVVDDLSGTDRQAVLSGSAISAYTLNEGSRL
ncbi:amidohydrolase family protein [Agrobacterium rhizogenes]|nr:amidohydrolase family protein [Rhizobium rhizogenes]NTJ79408.1 amidohydrolase family protein [Rhizobium rhizogenes]